MSLAAKRSLALLFVLSGSLFFFSCAPKTDALKPGTPGFYWSAAKQTYAAGDYAKTTEHLDNLLTSENEYSARALPWSLVLDAGMSAGYMDLADAYEEGGRMNKTDPSSFRRLVSQYRANAGRLSLQVAERYGQIEKQAGDAIPLAFSYPRGSAGEVPQLSKVGKGMMLPPAEVEAVQKRTLERGILLAAGDIVGAPNDTAKAQQAYAAPEPKAPRAAFEMAMANTLLKNAMLYTRDKLDDPKKLQILAERAQTALKAVPESKDTKALDAKIQSALKKAKKS
jgi:hypothetical protein